MIVEIDSRGRYEIIAREKESVRLGSGAQDFNNLAEDAMERGAGVLARYARLARSMGAEPRAVATSAVREAGNKSVFIERIKDECDLKLEVISGVEEARLIYLGALQALPIYDHRALLIDIGGGSTEFLIGRGGNVEYANSLKLGAIRLTDRFFREEPITKTHIIECRKAIRVALERVKRETKTRGFDIAVGSSGTIDTIADMIIKQTSKKKDTAFSEKVLELSDLNQITDAILASPLHQDRAKIDGLDERRSDIIVAGAIILQEIFHNLGINKMRFSPYALREGIIFDTVQRNGIPVSHSPDIRRSSVDHLAERFSQKGMPAIESARHISRLALRIYDELSRLRLIENMNHNDAFLLESAALLHNIGIVIAHSAHHKHGYYILKNTEHLLGFTPLEIEIMAQLTRYHRKALPAKKHNEFQILPADVRDKIEILGSILRVAIGLERGGRKRVVDIRINQGHDSLVFNIVPELDTSSAPYDVTLELWAARMKADWFARSFNKTPEFRISFEF